MSAAVTSAFDLVMFDLDGTLVATAPEILDAVNDTLRRLGLAEVQLAQVEIWIGHGTRELLAQALASVTSVDPDKVRGSSLFHEAMLDFTHDYERRCGTRSSLYPKVREVLEMLGERGVKRALVTNKEERFTRSVLRQHGMTSLLDYVICGDSLPTKKPDPAGLLDCMDHFAAPPERCVFVGDSSIDVATARNAGVPVWAVTYGYNMGVPIDRSSPDRLLTDLQPLLAPGR